MFLVYRISIAISINAILLVFLIYFIKKGLYIFEILHVEDHHAMTGQIQGTDPGAGSIPLP